MSPQEGFDIQIGQSCSCAYIRVVDRVTGESRSADCQDGESIEEVKSRLIADLQAHLHGNDSGATR